MTQRRLDCFLFPYTTLFRSPGPVTPVHRRLQVTAALLAVWVLWGSTFLGIRVMVRAAPALFAAGVRVTADRKSTRLNSSHANSSYAVFCLKKKKKSEERSSL